MDTEFKVMLVAIALILGSIGLRVNGRTARSWWFAVLYTIFGGVAGFWFAQTPLAALTGGAACAVSMYVIRPLVNVIVARMRAFRVS